MTVVYVLWALLDVPDKPSVQASLLNAGIVAALKALFRMYTWGTTLTQTDTCITVR